MKLGWPSAFSISKTTLFFVLAVAVLLFVYYGYVQNQTLHLEKRNFRQLAEIGNNIEANIAANKALKLGFSQDRAERIVRKSAFILNNGQILNSQEECKTYQDKQGDRIKTAAYFDRTSGRVFFVAKDKYEDKGEEDEDEMKGECFYVGIDALMEKNMPSNSYSKIILATQDGEILEGVSGGSRRLAGNEWSRLLSPRESHLHFVSTKNWTGDASLNGSEPGQALADGHVQSSIRTTSIGSEKYQIFVQPFTPGNLQVSNGDATSLEGQTLLIIGLVNSKDYDAERMIPPVNLGGVVFLAAVLALLSLSLLRIFVIGDRAIVTGREVCVAIACFQIIAAVLVLVVMDWRIQGKLTDSYDEDIKRIANEMDRSLQLELEQTLEMLLEWHSKYEDADKGGKELTGVKLKLCPGRGEVKRFGSNQKLVDKSKTPKALRLYYHCNNTDVVPRLRTAFFLDENGDQIGPYLDYYDQGKDFTVGINLSTRAYFQRAFKDQLWTLRNASNDTEKPTYEVPRLLPAFFLDEKAGQIGPYLDYYDQSEKFSVGIDFSNMTYVQRAFKDQLWTWALRNASADTEDANNRFFLQRVESRADSSKVSILSTRVVLDDIDEKTQTAMADSEGKSRPAVAVASFHMQTFENVVLPPAIGFAVIDSETGSIIYHSDDGRSLRENIFDAVDHDPELKASLLTGISRNTSMDYSGDNIRVRSKPLGSVPWTLLVYYNQDLLQSVNLQITFAAVWMLLLYFLALFVIAFLGWLLVRRVLKWIGDAPPYHTAELGWLFPHPPFRPAYLLTLAVLLVPSLLYGSGPMGWFGSDYASPLELLGLDTLMENSNFTSEQQMLLETLLYLCLSLLSVMSVVLVLYFASLRLVKKRGQFKLSVFTYESGISLLILVTSVLPALFIYFSSMKLYEPVVDRYTAWHVSVELEQRVNGYIDWILKRRGDGYSEVKIRLTDTIYHDVSGNYLNLDQFCIGPATGTPNDADEAAASAGGAAGNGECRRIQIETWGREIDVEPLGREIDDRAEAGGAQVIPTQVIDSASNFIGLSKAFSGNYPGRCAQPDTCREETKQEHTPLIFPQHSTNRLLVFDKTASSGIFASIKVTDSKSFWLLAILAALIFGVVHLFLYRLSFLNAFALIDGRRTRRQIEQVPGVRICVPPFLSEAELLQHIQNHCDVVPNLTACTGDFRPLQQRENADGDPPAVYVLSDWYRKMENAGASQQLLGAVGTLADSDCLLFIAEIDPYHWFNAADELPSLGSTYAAEFAPDWTEHEERWARLFSDLEPLDYRLFGVKREHRLPMRASTYDRIYDISTQDEKIVLACIAWNGYFNPANLNTALSLYHRGLIDRTYGKLFIPDDGLRQLVRLRFPRRQLSATRLAYEDDKWHQLKLPLVVLATLVLAFFAYVAKDQLQSLLAIFAALAGTATTLRDHLAKINPFAAAGAPGDGEN